MYRRCAPLRAPRRVLLVAPQPCVALLAPCHVAGRAGHSTADAGNAHAWVDGELRPEYSTKNDRKKLNPATMAHFVQAKIQNERRDMGLPEITNWEEFAEHALFIPTKSGPLWCGADDPRTQQFVRRKEKHKVNPLQVARKDPGDDAMVKLEDHPLRPYFSEPSDLHDPLSVATGLYKAGMIKSFDVKYTASRIAFVDRPPVVTVMGHVDHGKTTLLDYLRKANVAAQEAGGITQAVGAFSVKCPGSDENITFIDTPGHKAFSDMRKVGAGCTDIIVLVISTVDGVQPQTLEVIEIAKAAKLPIVVAANKIDRSQDVEPIKKALREMDIITEDDGGDVQLVRVSAVTGEGIPALLEAIQLQAALSELTAPSPARAEISIIESRSLGETEVMGIVKCGVVKSGMTFASGLCYATVTKVCNEFGELAPRTGLGVSRPVLLSGFKMLPKPGNTLFQLSSDQHGERYYELMREVYKHEGRRETYLQTLSAESKGKLWNRKSNNDTPRAFDEVPINLMCYAATFGQLQALMALLYAIPRIEGVNLVIKGTEVGGPDDQGVTVMTSIQQPGAVLVFGKVQDRNRMSFPSRVDMFRFDVVYHGVEWLKKRMVAALPKKKVERTLATAVCRQLFRASQAGGGNAAGLFVSSGTVYSNQHVVVMRVEKKGEEAVRVYSGKLKELRRFKEIVTSVDQNLECGMILYNEFQFRVGDTLHCVEVYDEEPDVDAIFDAAEEKERVEREIAIRNETGEQEAHDAKVAKLLSGSMMSNRVASM